ncbi:MAG TPA: acyl-CoA dehydrogenase C-terminal domain-containing protein, partial [Arenimonas sp.]|nr:acyl-CoA dehydrogenase C-terminal domain-containing protein [Arenimonas sp.]
LCYAWMWARMAAIALDKQDSQDDFYLAKLATARFYYAKLLPETLSLIAIIKSGSDPVMAMDERLF